MRIAWQGQKLDKASQHHNHVGEQQKKQVRGTKYCRTGWNGGHSRQEPEAIPERRDRRIFSLGRRAWVHIHTGVEMVWFV